MINTKGKIYKINKIRDLFTGDIHDSEIKHKDCMVKLSDIKLQDNVIIDIFEKNIWHQTSLVINYQDRDGKLSIVTHNLVYELEEIKEKEIDLTAEELLEASIKYGAVLTAINDNIRGHGKTTALVKKAHELDVPIIAGSETMKNHILKVSESLNLSVKCFCVYNEQHARGLALGSKEFLVDDSTSNLTIYELKKRYNCLGGFNTIGASIANSKTPKSILEELRKEYSDKLDTHIKKYATAVSGDVFKYTQVINSIDMMINDISKKEFEDFLF